MPDLSIFAGSPKVELVNVLHSFRGVAAFHRLKMGISRNPMKVGLILTHQMLQLMRRKGRCCAAEGSLVMTTYFE